MRMKKNISEQKCPCYSGKAYGDCCKPFHERSVYPDKAEQLMRSRYAAYALKLTDYIIATTHPANPNYKSDHLQWKQDILDFSSRTQFVGLEILECSEENDVAYVTFHAKLKQGKADVSFIEKSRFDKMEGHWCYSHGVPLPKKL